MLITNTGFGEVPGRVVADRLRVLDSQKEMPRFLFRGFNEHHGGNASLNTKTCITPHAFYGSHADVNPNEPGGKQVTSIPMSKLRAQVDAHLTGRTAGRSPFCSWTADWQTAIDFAGVGHNVHIAVMDTSLKGQHTHVWHVPALVKAGITKMDFIEEYLIYGPVRGKDAYVACCSVDELRRHVEKECKDTQRSFFSSAPATGAINSIQGLVQQAHYTATAFSQYNSVKFQSDVYFTIFAAELARHRTPVSRCSRQQQDLTLLEKQSIDSLFPDAAVARWAAEHPSGKPLVNPLTDSDGQPQVLVMIRILQFLERGIAKESEKLPQKSKAKTQPTVRPAFLVALILWIIIVCSLSSAGLLKKPAGSIVYQHRC